MPNSFDSLVIGQLYFKYLVQTSEIKTKKKVRKKVYTITSNMIEPYIKNTRHNQFISLPEASNKKMAGYNPGHLDFVMRSRKLRVQKIGDSVVVTENAIASLMQFSVQSSSTLPHSLIMGSQEMKLFVKKAETKKIQINLAAAPKKEKENDLAKFLQEQRAQQNFQNQQNLSGNSYREEMEQMFFITAPKRFISKRMLVKNILFNLSKLIPVFKSNLKTKLVASYDATKNATKNIINPVQKYFELDKNFVVSASLAIVLLSVHGFIGQYQKDLAIQKASVQQIQIVAQQKANALNLSQRISKVNPGSLTLPSTSVGKPSPVLVSDTDSVSDIPNQIVYLQGKSEQQGPQGAVGPHGPEGSQSVQGQEDSQSAQAIMQNIFGDESGNEFLGSSKSVADVNPNDNFTVGGSSTFSGILTYNGGLTSPETLSLINQSLLSFALETNVENIWFASANIDGRATFALNTIVREDTTQFASAINDDSYSDTSSIASNTFFQSSNIPLNINADKNLNQNLNGLDLIQPTSGLQLEAFGNVNNTNSNFISSSAREGPEFSDLATLILSG